MSQEKTGKKRKREEKQKKSKRRKITHEEKPKRPLSSFLLFSKEKRPELKGKDEYMKEGKNGKTVNDITKIAIKLGHLWGELTIEEKEPYNVEYKKDVKKYKKKLKVYQKAMKKSMKKAMKKKKRKKRRETSSESSDESDSD